MGGRGVRRSTNRGSDESVRSAVSSVWSVLSTNTLGRWRSKEAYSSTTKRSQKTSNGVKYGQLVDDYEPVGGAGTLDNFLDGIANGEHESDTLGASSVAKTIHSQNTFMSYFSGRNRKSKNSSKRTGVNDSDSTSPSHTSSPKGKHRFFRLVLRRKNTNDTSSKAPSPPNDQRRFLRFTSRKKAKLDPSSISLQCSIPSSCDKEDAAMTADKSKRLESIESLETFPGPLTLSRNKECATLRNENSNLENSAPPKSSPDPLNFSLEKEVTQLTSDESDEIENTASSSSVSNRTLTSNSENGNGIGGESQNDSFTTQGNTSTCLADEPTATEDGDGIVGSSYVPSGLTEENDANSDLGSGIIPDMASTSAPAVSFNGEEKAPKEQIAGYSLTKSWSAEEDEVPPQCQDTSNPDILNAPSAPSANMNCLTGTEESGQAAEVKFSLLIRERKKLFKELAANSLLLESVDYALHHCESKSHKARKSRRSGVSRSRDSKSYSKRSSPSHRSISGAKSKPRSKHRDSALSMVNNIRWTIVSPRPRKGLYSGVAVSGTVPHGFGTLNFENGDMYVGPFKSGEMHGSNAAFVAACGSLYRGGFQRNLKHGTGTEIMPNGDRYVGRHEYGFPHGFGILFDASGSIIKGGKWHGGALVESDATLAIEDGADDESVSSSVASMQSDVSSVSSVSSADSLPCSAYDDVVLKPPTDPVAVVPVAKNSPLTYSTRRAQRERESQERQ